MKKQVTKSVCLVICLSMVITVSAYTAELAKTPACITVAEYLKTDKKADAATLEKYKVNKVAPRSSDTFKAENSFLKREVSYAIIPDNPLI